MLTRYCQSSIVPSFARLFADATQTLYEKVNKLIEEKVRPVLKMDGGDIVLEDIKDGIAIVTLEGMCSSCPSSRNTLQNGVLGAIQDEYPEIIGIRQKLDFEDL